MEELGQFRYEVKGDTSFMSLVAGDKKVPGEIYYGFMYSLLNRV